MLIKFIISYYKKAPLKMFFGFLMLVAVDIAQLISPRIVQKAIDYIILTYTNSENDYSYLLWKFTLLIFALAVAIGIFRFFWRMIILGMSHFIEMDFKNRLFKHLLSLSHSFFSKTKTGDIMAHMTNDPQIQVGVLCRITDRYEKKEQGKAFVREAATSDYPYYSKRAKKLLGKL